MKYFTHSFVARQLLLRIYALLSVQFPGLKLRLCRKWQIWGMCSGGCSAWSPASCAADAAATGRRNTTMATIGWENQLSNPQKSKIIWNLIWTPPKSQLWDCQFICLIDVITNMNDPTHIFKHGPPCPGANNIGKISFTFSRIWQSFSNTWGKWECLHIEICTFCRLKIQSSPILLAGSSWPPWGETSTGGGPTKRLELDIS